MSTGQSRKERTKEDKPLSVAAQPLELRPDEGQDVRSQQPQLSGRHAYLPLWDAAKHGLHRGCLTSSNNYPSKD